MSVNQVKAAIDTPEQYWLCVVAIEEGEVTSDIVRSNARFVCDIGFRLKDAWTRYEGLRDATLASVDISQSSSCLVSPSVELQPPKCKDCACAGGR
jgi:hypothetical protein